MALTQVQSGLLESGAALTNIGAGNITPSYLSTQSQYTGFKNRIINGAMVIDQRNAGASVTPAVSSYTLDRWRLGASAVSKVSVQQSTNAPTGFSNSALITTVSQYTIGANEEINFGQRIEGFNFSDFGFGTANAQPISLSFWVRSSLTGLFGGVLSNEANTRRYVFSYTISFANTWEYKTITIVGETTGTWTGSPNAIGLLAQFSIAAGSSLLDTAGAWLGVIKSGVTGQNQLVATNGATWQVTGVQLEKGSTATSFDYRPYGTELSLCQRYYEKSYNIDVVPGTAGNYLGITKIQGTTDVSSNASAQVSFKVPKRVNATMTYFNAGSGASGTWDYARSGASGSPSALSDQPSMGGVLVYGAAGGSAYIAVNWAGHWVSSAEL